MKKTFSELLILDNAVANLYSKDPEIRQTKFGYNYTPFYEKSIQPVLKELNEEIKSTQIDFALEDEKTKAIMMDDKSDTGFAHSKEGMKALLKAKNELIAKYNTKEVDIEPRISSYIPEMSDETKEILTGIII